MRKNFSYLILALLLCVSVIARADERPNTDNRPYLCEIGIQGGCGYYVGDATPHIFTNVREAYGLHFRYKFTKRWAIQVKASGQRIAGDHFSRTGVRAVDSLWQNQLVNVDVMAEFNFLRFGSSRSYDTRIKPYTPYIFIGIGASMYQNIPTENYAKWTFGGYVPLGIGFKWKFYDWCGLNIAWQHNIYFSDDIEGAVELNNSSKINGTNWTNCDVTGMLTLGLVFEFGKAAKPCKVCNW